MLEGGTAAAPDGRKEGAMRATRNLGLKLLGAWLIAHALFSLTTFLPGAPLLLALLAFVAGVLILAGR
jgi:hypothetical protein